MPTRRAKPKQPLEVSDMDKYLCARCREPRTDISIVGIQCEKCGSKVFYKERPNVKKVVQST